MSECIVRMEMPENCLKCPLHEFGGVCLLKVEHTAEEWLNIDKRRPANCPIICQLPEGHGRLGDLDELAAGCDDPYWCRWLSEIEDAPTIVPAEAERSET